MQAGLRTVLLTTMLLDGIFAQQPRDSSLFVARWNNLHLGDSIVTMTNSGALGASLSSGIGASVTGAICANVYMFAPTEEFVSCCSCPITPNGLVSIRAVDGVRTLNLFFHKSLVVKILATVPVAGRCTAAQPGPLAPGLHGWSATLLKRGDEVGDISVTETPLARATLSSGELSRMTNLCLIVNANGSGFETCRPCRLGTY